MSWMYVGPLGTRAPSGRGKAMSINCWISSTFLRNMAWSSLGMGEKAVSVSIVGLVCRQRLRGKHCWRWLEDFQSTHTLLIE